MKKAKLNAGSAHEISRRHFLAGVVGAGVAVTILPFITSPALGADAPAPKTPAKKPLVVYFSKTGNTRKVAEAIHKQVGGDIQEIEVVEAYPVDYKATTEKAKAELQANARPAIKTKIPNIDDYGVIFLGYPLWWDTMPMAVFTFMEQNNLDGKTIAPFDTHGGGGLGKSVADIKKLAPHSKIVKPLSVRGSDAASSAETEVKKWLEGLGTALIETTTGNTTIYPDGAY